MISVGLHCYSTKFLDRYRCCFLFVGHAILEPVEIVVCLKIISQPLAGMTEENCENRQSRYSLPYPRLEQDTYKTRIISVTFMLTLSMFLCFLRKILA